AFSSGHRFESSFWWAQWVRNHSEHRHSQRVQALESLRRTMREAHLTSVAQGIEARRPGGDGELVVSILAEELQLPEVDRIYHLQNSRTREEAWLSFSQRLREG